MLQLNSTILANPEACVRACYLAALMFCRGDKAAQINSTPLGDCGFRRNGKRFELLWYGKTVVTGGSMDEFSPRVIVWMRTLSNPRQALSTLGLIQEPDEGNC